MKRDNFTYLQDITSSNTKLVTPPMQQSGCPTQTSTVSKLLGAHSRCNRLSSIVSVSYGPYVNIHYPINSGSDQIVKIPVLYIPTHYSQYFMAVDIPISKFN